MRKRSAENMKNVHWNAMTKQNHTDNVFSLRPDNEDFSGKKQRMSRSVAVLLEQIFKLNEFPRIYEDIKMEDSREHFATQVLRHLQITVSSTQKNLEERIPKKGPVVVIANHPFGGVEGLILMSLLSRCRNDVKVIANALLGRLPELRHEVISVDVFSGKQSAARNVQALRAAKLHLEGNGILVLFPAGEVSHFSVSRMGISDPGWVRSLNWLLKKTCANVLPVYFDGRNSIAFQVAGLFHPRLRTALLPRELLNKARQTIQVEIGQVITNERLARITSEQSLLDYLRFRTYLLQQRLCRKRTQQAQRRQQKIAQATASELLVKDVAALPQKQRLHGSGSLSVFYASASQLPHVLPEIGRLREMTFRLAEEGTGKARDLDRYDDHYLHLFVWDEKRQAIAGAYRMGDVQAIYAAQGKKGLYTSSLFSYRKRFFADVGPALEMGRSFICPEYQKSFGPLLLLWKGIGRYIARHPQYSSLFGPVSISRSYSDFSRQLIAASLHKNLLLPAMARQVKPHRGVKVRPQRISGCEETIVATFAHNIDEVAHLIGDIEAQQKDIPVLLKFYLSLGCRVLAFNKDPLFGDVIDGLVLVDLRLTEEKTLRRYMGEEGVRQFLHFHSQRGNSLKLVG